MSHWTKKESSLARGMLKEGESLEDISDALGTRTPGAVGYKAVKFGFMTPGELKKWYREDRSRKSKERSKDLYRWRNAVLEKDGHRCVVCKTEKVLEAHHIIPFREIKKHEVRLGITLCADCHSVVGTHPDNRNPRITQWERRKRWGKYASVLQERGFDVKSVYCRQCRRIHLRVNNNINTGEPK